MKFPKQTKVNIVAKYSQTELVETIDGDVNQLVKYYVDREHSTDVVARWHYEYQIAQSYSLKSLLTPKRIINAQSDLAIFFEHFKGVTLRTLIEEKALSVQQKFNVAVKLILALAELHQHQIIHRNINLDNVLVNMETGDIKFSDLTLVTAHSSTQVSKSPLLHWHCLDYLAPELTGRTRLNVDHRTDVYMLGCVLYHLFSDQKPFQLSDKSTLVHAHITQKPELLSSVKTDLPFSLVGVLDKMMEKSPDDRYQSLFGVEYDLVQIQQGKALNGIAEKDFSSKLIWPHKLYGRESELAELNSLLSRSSQANQLAMVSGYSGIGKTALVDELQKPILEQGGFLLKGKCEQFGGGKPYGVLSEAFAPLFSYIDTLSTIEQQHWKEMFEQELNENISLISELVPDFADLFPAQQALPTLPISEQETRFKNTMATFINAVSKKLTKLVVFLDDLQWADTSTINLIEHLFKGTTSANTLVLGAYRSNEVSDTHPLALSLKNIEQVHGLITQIKLSNLEKSDVSDLLQDALFKNVDDVESLVDLSLSKTKGNPFFLHQFINSLAEENILYFEQSIGSWAWDIKEIIDQDITENVVELMVQQLQKLPDITQHLLTYAAHLGSQFDLNLLSVVNQSDSNYVATHLKEAIVTGLILPLTDDFQFSHSPESLLKAKFRFSHDRVQQAAYSLTPIVGLQKLQRHVGLSLLKYCDETGDFDSYLFTLLEQLNPARDIIEQGLHGRLLTLNLDAANRAKQSSAFTVALEFLQVAESLLVEDCWQNTPDDALAVYRELSEVSYLAGQYEQTETLCKQHIELASTVNAKITLSICLVQLLQTQMRFPEAIDAAQDALALLGLRLPDDEEESHALLVQEFEKMEHRISDVSADDMLSLPEISDHQVLQLLALYESTLNPCYLTGRQFTYCLVATRMTELTLTYGQCDITSIAVRSYMMTRARMQRPYKECYDVGKLACQFADKHDNRFYSSAVYQVFGAGYQTWVEPMHNSFPLLRTAVDWGFEGINPVYAGYSALMLSCNLMVKGLPLKEVAKDVERGQALFAHTHQPMGAMYMSVAVENPMLALMGDANDALTCDTDTFSVTDTFKGDYATPSMELALHSYAMLRNAYLLDSFELQQRFVPLLPLTEAFMPDSTLTIDGNFFAGLCVLSWAFNDKDNRAQHIEQAATIATKFETWAKDCVDNFEHKWLMLSAEIAALNEDHLKAQSLYSQAIQSAQDAEYLSCEALANELYAKYWQRQNQPQAAESFIIKAYDLYNQWQGNAKLQQIEQAWPMVSFFTGASKQFDDLDLETMLEVNQVLSSEIQLDSLLDKLIFIAIQNSGADRACLLTIADDEIYLRASGDIDTRNIFEELTLSHQTSREMLPASVIHKVNHTSELLLVDKPTTQYEFINEPYFKHNNPLTIACVPIMYQGKLFGFLYLENYATANAFNTAQVNLLESISVQAAVSLSNALVYKTLEQRVEQRTTDLVEAKQKAEEATLAKSNFLANMSHEIRTPMNAVIGLSRLAMRTKLSKEQKDYVTNILGSSESLLSLINDILDFSKIEAGKMQLEETRFELDKVIEQGVGVCTLKAHEKRVELITYVDPNIPNALFGDPLRLQQVITNLTSNAVKFTEKGTVSIEVAMQRTKSHIELAFKVKDSGIGISEEQQQRLFQSFSQADESVTRKYGGTGLGLAICKELVEMMGGQISVSSQLEQGSEFSFTVKLTEVEIPKRADTNAVQKTLSELNVLVVDDIELSRKSIIDTLHSSGVNATAVHDGQQAIDAVKASIANNNSYDLIFMDWQMPNVDGIQASKFIREELDHEAPSILLVSAYDRDEVKNQASDIAIDGFIEKPVNQSHLLDHIMELTSGELGSKSEVTQVEAPNLLDFNILLVEDNAINQQVTLGFLADTHVRVDVAENGQVAVDMVQAKDYDLILMDIQMPVMDGLTATQIIREKHNQAVPIIAMTAHAMEGDAQKSMAHGMNAHLAKPIEPDLLFSTLSTYLNAESKSIRQQQNTETSPAGAQSKVVEKNVEQPNLVDSAQKTWLDALNTTPTINVDEAIFKLKGKTKLYEGLVKDFVRANKDIEEKVAKVMSDNNDEELYRMIHSLKSSAAYIGAETLSQQANSLEQLLAQEEASKQSIAQVITSTKNLVADIEKATKGAKPVSSSERLSPAQIKAMLSDISAAAVDFNVDAEELSEQLYQGCVGTDYEELAKSVYEELNDFEYELALKRIDQLMEALAD